MAMKKFSELVNSVTTRIASRNNPTGLKASDLGAYSTAEFNTEMEKYIDIDVTDIEQVGDQSYFPLAIEGSADGAIGLITDYRHYGICRESDGTIVLLRSATNSIIHGVYYVICKTDQNGAVTSVIPTSRQYQPAMLDLAPKAIYCHQNNILLGLAADINGNNAKMFIALTDGTFDASKHVAMYIDGALSDFKETMPDVCCWEINGTIYIGIAVRDGYKLSLKIYTVQRSSIAPTGGSVSATLITNINGVTIEGTQVNNSSELIVCNRISANSFPSNGIGQIIWRAAIRLWSTVKNGKARILVGSSWWTNDQNNHQRQGMHHFYIDFDPTNNRYAMNPGSGQATYYAESNGIAWRGPSTFTQGESNYKDGYWVWGAHNCIGNININDSGQVIAVQNDNNGQPDIRTYTIGNFAGTAYDEIAKMNPDSTLYTSAWLKIKDRVVGALAAHGYLAFLSATKIYTLSSSGLGQGHYDARTVSYQGSWTNYHYHGNGIDVYGFMPSSNFTVLNSLAAPFLTIYRNGNVTLSGSYLNDLRLSSNIGLNYDTLIPEGEAISISEQNLKSAGQTVWNAYTGTKLNGITDWKQSITIPPEATNAPCLMVVLGFSSSQRKMGVVIAEVNVSARKGSIAITGVQKVIAYVERVDTVNIWADNRAYGSFAYMQSTDGWLVAGHVPLGRGTSGNSNTFQFRAGRKSDGSWVNAAYEDMYTYLQNSGYRWNIHPTWGIGYVNTSESTIMGNGGQIFNVIGTTIDDYITDMVTSRIMTSTVIASSGFDVYVNEDITCLFAGKTMTLPKGHYNLKDYNSFPGNKTWYVSVVPNGNQLELELTIHKQEDDKGQRVNIGTITTSDTQISVINLNKTTKLGTVTL